ncbi:MAG: hypothetical protein LBC07_03580 [Elusimicrobiota bacterium]|jgi:hypothetical protein|nr:hypothetical protein [Elusimicrobiota bacterium]
MKKFIFTVLVLGFFVNAAAATDVNIGVGGAYNSSINKYEYSGLFELLFPVVPGLKIGGGGQYYSYAEDLELDRRDFALKDASYAPVYVMARIGVPIPILPALFATGRLGRVFLFGSDTIPQGWYYSVGLGTMFFSILYMEATYSVYEWNDYDVKQERYALNFGISL